MSEADDDSDGECVPSDSELDAVELVWNACGWYCEHDSWPHDGTYSEPSDDDMAWRMIKTLEDRELYERDICWKLLILTPKYFRFRRMFRPPVPPPSSTFAECLLRRAAALDRPQTAILLLDHGVRLDFDESHLDLEMCLGTALVNACEAGHTEMARLLLQRGAQINAWTRCCQFLSVDIGFRSIMDWTALHAACAWGNLETVKLLIEQRADVQISCRYTDLDWPSSGEPMTRDGPSAFHLACARGHHDVVAFLYETLALDIEAMSTMYGFSLCGADGSLYIDGDPESPTFGWTGDVMIDDLAHITFPNSYTEHGLDYHDRADDFPWIPINACKTVTGSPLLLACVRGCADVIQFLLDHGANADARAADGSTPLSILQAFEHTKEAQILVSATLGLEAGQRRGTPIKMRAQHVGIQLEDTPSQVRTELAEGSPGTRSKARAQMRAIQKGRVQRVTRAEQVGTARAAGLRAKETQRMASKRGEPNSGRRVYVCGKCGEPKKGHVCKG